MSLLTRIRERNAHIKIAANKHKPISKHYYNFNHSFDFENAKTLDKELLYNKRIISEMMFKENHDNTVNNKLDTENLNMHCLFL